MTEPAVLDTENIFDDLPNFDNVEDALDPAPEPTTEVSTGPQCDVCGTGIPWSGRGRKPKKCIDHKTRTSSSISPRRVSSKTSARLEQLEADLLQESVTFGKTVSQIFPTLGVVTVSRAPKTASALTRIARDHPKVLAALEVSTKIIPVLDLGETFLALGVALLVDLGQIKPDSPSAQMLGVTEIWKSIYEEETQNSIDQYGKVEPANIGFPAQQVPPRFAKVVK
jgi:hypothetical protein